MLWHIVKTNETIDDIVELYKVSREEIAISNMHLANIDNIQFGTLLRIPLITMELDQVLSKTDPFKSDYFNENYKKDIEKLHNESTNKRIAYAGILPPKNPYRGNRF